MLDFEQEGLEIVSLFCDSDGRETRRNGDRETWQRGDAGLCYRSHLARVGRVLVRIGWCDFVDRLCFSAKRNDPRIHTN